MTESNDYNNDGWLELAGLSDYITQFSSGSSVSDVRLEDVYKYLKNPYENIKEIQKIAKYLTNKNGIVKETLRTFKSLPTLDYILSWSEVDDDKKLKKYERKVNDFLDDIELKTFVRDGLYECAELGTVVTCLRNKRYVQFLEIDDLRINRQRNGKWVVEYDLRSIDQVRSTREKNMIIESLPDEVTTSKYLLYKNKGEDYRYVELKNCDVVPLDAHRNFPYGLPISMGAWTALLQKDLIDKVERSVADRLIKQIVILYASTLDKNGEKPPSKEVITTYFKEVSALLQKKEGSSRRSNNTSGTGSIALPHFLKLDTLKVDTEMFKQELYDKINNDIYANLGISPALIWGGGSSGNFSSAELSSKKLFRYIFSVLEKFEIIINSYIKQILPNNVSCKFIFSKTNLLDKDKHIDQLKELYMQTSGSKFWIEEVTGLPYEDVIKQIEYEKKVLKTGNILIPPQNAYTKSSKDSNNVGRPPEESPSNENTIKNKGNGTNGTPYPSTQ